ncbi:MAG TPA: hypothetical protein VIG72_13815 [Pontibacter sp.]
MERDERNRYYHGGAGDENRRDWDRNSRDGDFGRDYENRFRSSRDRDQDYRRHYHALEDEYDRSVQGNGPGMSTIRQGYGIASFEGRDRFTDTGEDIAQRMRRDRERLQQQGYGSGQMGGYSGSAFGGSNYSSHGDFGGASNYGSMSGGGGNVDEYVSMSGYGGDRGSISNNHDRGVPDYSNRQFGDQYGEGLGSGRGGTGRGNYSSFSNYSPDNYSSSKGNDKYTGYRHQSNSGNYSSDYNNRDRGGYENYDPNNRWNS